MLIDALGEDSVLPVLTSLTSVGPILFRNLDHLKRQLSTEGVLPSLKRLAIEDSSIDQMSVDQVLVMANMIKARAAFKACVALEKLGGRWFHGGFAKGRADMLRVLLPSLTELDLSWHNHVVTSCFNSELVLPQLRVLDITVFRDHAIPSAFCERHRYKPQEEVFLEVLQQNAALLKIVDRALDEEDLTYKPLLEKLGVAPSPKSTPTETALAILKTPDEIGQQARKLVGKAGPVTAVDVKTLRAHRPKMSVLVKEAERQITGTQAYQNAVTSAVLTQSTQQAAAKSAMTVLDTLKTTQKLDTATASRLLQKTEGTWVKDRGVVLESSAENALRDMCPEDCVVKTQEYAMLKIRINGGAFVVQIPCRPDVLFVDQDGVDSVFEIKTRKDHFFVPAYDVDQLCLYVTATNALNGGTVVEQLQGVQRHSRQVELEEARSHVQEVLLPALAKSLNLFFYAVRDPMAFRHHKIWQGLRGTRHYRPANRCVSWRMMRRRGRRWQRP